MKEFPRRVAVLHSIERGCDEGKSRGGMRERLKRAVLKKVQYYHGCSVFNSLFHYNMHQNTGKYDYSGHF